MTVTLEEASGWHMQEATHYNGGKVFFAYLHRCVEQPRLSRFDKYVKATRSSTSTWRVDGQDVATFAEAIDRLNTPPAFTAEELAFIASVPDHYDPDIDIGKTMDIHVADSARNKGAVEWEKGRCRRTDVGRSAMCARP
ncbi:MAG: hypothetical protein E5X35_07360 [Mesorhizobium sp.]|uniref:hypothetical protein n=1 Tax=Mesorhizobium sp. TaxID=1871066 RepID=UPI001200A651|nr:hypothetical protein [Mesorhizobium sp.]TIR34526.1 MAG: hypothetical protein E5X35_07360 [Mesorhizobium sp.]